MTTNPPVAIDINADAGESFGPWRMGSDAALFPLLTSVNLAAGFHAGDPLAMLAAVELAKEHGVAVGVHPGFPDLVGFGRRDMEVTPEHVYTDVLYQIGALSAFLKARRMSLHHVKPHGALYNRATRHAQVARAIADAVRDYDPELPLVVLAGSLSERVAREAGTRVAPEAFPDRAYLPDGTLAPRSMKGALLHDPDRAAERAVSMALEGRVAAHDGQAVSLRPETLCIHGDNPEAPAIARAIRQALTTKGVTVIAY
jgi:5-oxoprolinase (ATP-hydrolysing) subunit A